MTRTVLIVGPTPPPDYGVAIATRTILESSLRSQFRLVHLDTSDRRAGTNFGKLDLTNLWLAVKHILQLLWELIATRPSIVYIPISQGALGYLRDAVFILLAAVFGRRIVLHLRGAMFRSFYLASSSPLRWLIRITLARADRMIVLGECLRDLFDGLLDSARIRVVPNGVDPSSFAPRPPTSPRAVPVVCFLGNLYRSKGYMDLLHALARIPPETPFECRLAGEWRAQQEEAEAKDFLARSGIADRVHFVGIVRGPAKRSFLEDADIFAFPTYYPPEGHPWVILEAMAAGLPVISTRHACIPETVTDGETGYLVDKRDVDALASRLLSLLRNPELRLRMGAAGRRRLESHFSEQLFISRLAAVFAEFHPPCPQTPS